MFTLGINAAYHDSSACLIRDGAIVAAVEEERFTRIKHAKRPVPFSAYELPYHAIDYCLAAADIGLNDVDHVAYAYDPFQLLPTERPSSLVLPLEPSAESDPAWDSPWEPLFISYTVNAPRQLVDGVPHHLRARWPRNGRRPAYRWHYVDHHLAHEASAYLASPYSRAAVLTMDGRGERTTTSYAVGEGTRLTRLGQVRLPHSLGLLYEALTRHLGFLHSSDEYKVMALAAFGQPRFYEEFREMVQLGANGDYRVADPALERRFGPAREPGEALQRRHLDLACSLQRVLEETVLELAHWLHGASGCENLCLAGGVALNCVMTGRLLREGPFRRLWVQPAAGDAGTALGAALWVDARERGTGQHASLDSAALGPAYSDVQIAELLSTAKLSHRRLQDLAPVAELLARDRLVAWFDGHLEFGPRALGQRSILASPLRADAPARLNALKGREEFRPVAPAVIREEAGLWFEGCSDSPFMSFAFPVMPDKRSRIPGALHVDGTARVQTVDRRLQPRFHALLRAFERLSGVPVLINTSFNVRGQPIVCTPHDALASFFSSPLDALVIGSFLLEKQTHNHATESLGGRADLQAPASA